MTAPTNVLTINFGGIGDEILFLPTLKDLRAALPQAKITLLVEPRSRSVEQVTDLIDAVITFDIKKKPLLPGDLWQLLSLIRAGKYDLVISSGSSPQVAALLFLSAIPVRVGYGSNALAKLLLTHPVPLLRDQYAGNMYHDLIGGLKNFLKVSESAANSTATEAKSSSPQIPQILVKQDSRAAMQELLRSQQNNSKEGSGTAGSAPVKIVLIHPGTSTMAVQKGIIKGWPVQSWLELIQKLCRTTELPYKLQVILAGGPDDKDVIAELDQCLDRDNAGRPPNFQSFAGKTRGLSDLAALIDLSDLIICVDSAPMHLAVGLNKKTVALFGPTEPEKLIPDSANFKVLADRPPFTEQPRSLLDGLGVRLPPDTVYRSSLDLLRAE